MSANERQRQALALQREGLTRKQIAERLDTTENAVKHLITRAKNWETADSALVGGAKAIGADTPASVVWTKTHRDGSVTHSVMHSNKPQPPAPDDYADAIREALKGSTPPVKPSVPNAPQNMLAIYPVADLHMGLLTDEEEVGEDWDSKKAQRVFQDTFGRIVSLTPKAGTALLAQLGDLTHNDDQRNVTPQNKHQLDVDSRYFIVLRRAVAVMKWAIEALRGKYQNVIYCGRRGNHDITSHYAVTLALAEYYADAKDVTIITDASEFYVHEHGKSMIVLHHGDRAKPERLVHFAAAEWPEIWGRTRHRVALSGHVHHQTVKEIGGMTFESVGTIIPRDAYAHSHGYSTSRGLVSIVHHSDQGEVSRARVNLETKGMPT